MKKIIPFFIIASILLSACGSGETTPAAGVVESTAAAQETESAQTAEPTPEAATRLEVNEEALNGLEITVWTPWYGVEQSLFETFVREFNESNEWGIQVEAQSQINFANLFENTTAALPTGNKPDLVIALPEHAQEWYVEGVTSDLTDYADDPLYGIDAEDVPYAIQVVDMQGKVLYAGSARNDKGILSVSIYDLPNGLYHVNLVSENHLYYGRFVKQE